MTRLSLSYLITFALLGSGCASLPDSKVTWHKWPKGAYKGVPDRDFEKLGQVRTRIEYNSLDFENDEAKLCKNYFAKAAADLVRRAKEVGADAVIDVKSVVFQIDGRADLFETAECTDDGVEGQVLAQGVAIKWNKPLPNGVRVRMKPKSNEPAPLVKPVLAPLAGQSGPASSPLRIPASSSSSSSIDSLTTEASSAQSPR